MPDPLDLHQPLPDRAHEALRAAVVQAIADLGVQVQRISDAFLLLVSTADFAQATLNTTVSGQGAISQLKGAAEGLSRQVSAVNTRAEAAQINAGTALAGVDALQKTVADLTARLTAVEQNQPSPDPAPSP